MNKRRNLVMGLALVAALVAGTHDAVAQQAPADKPQLPCGLGIAQHGFPGGDILHQASLRSANLPAGNVRLTFTGHSTFLIETPKGVKAVTDYNDFVRPEILPDLITMNTGHATHSTDAPDPRIKHVLRGWKEDGGIARHNFRFKDMRVYNLPTNVGNFGGGFFNNSSIFVFEAAGLCIAHSGNLRHALDDERIARMGRIDIMLVAADRRITNSLEEVMHNIARIRPRLVIPMHFNFIDNALQFRREVKHVYPVKLHKSPVLEVNRGSLPQKTEILIMPGTQTQALGDQQL